MSDIPKSIAVNRAKLKETFSGAYARGLKNSHTLLTIVAFITFAVFCVMHLVIGNNHTFYAAVPDSAENKSMDMAVFIVIAVIAAVNLAFLVVISLALRKSYNYFSSQDYSQSQAYERIFKTDTINYDPRRLSMQVRIFSCIKTITALFTAVLFIANTVNIWKFALDSTGVFVAVISTVVSVVMLIFCVSAVAVCIFEGKAWENFADVYDGINTVSDAKTFVKAVKFERIVLIAMVCLSAVSIVYSINIITLPFLCIFFYYDKFRISVAEKFIEVFGGINAELLEQPK